MSNRVNEDNGKYIALSQYASMYHVAVDVRRKMTMMPMKAILVLFLHRTANHAVQEATIFNSNAIVPVCPSELTGSDVKLMIGTCSTF